MTAALITAAERVLAGLDARIDRSARSRVPAPVFEGIADLRSAVAAAKGAELRNDPPDLPDAPEEVKICPACDGEGAIEVYESVSRWSVDPACGHAIPCLVCQGAGASIDDMEPDA
jgi:hypothetical protein